MKRRPRQTIMNALRREATVFLALCTLILALPAVQPLAMAMAAQAGLAGVLCSGAGEAPGPDETPRDSCPCTVICSCMHCGPVSSGVAPEPVIAGLPVFFGLEKMVRQPASPLAPYRLPRGASIRAPPVSA